MIGKVVEKFKSIFKDAGEDFVRNLDIIRKNASGCVDEEEYFPC